MDRLIYTAMSGARQLMHRQETLANNLANLSTPGFRADMDAMRAVPLQGEGAGLGTRVLVAASTPGADFTPGAIQSTGRDLDVAIDGDGFFTVDGGGGTEAYTRNGGFEVGADGNLATRSGRTVMGDGGPIAVPANARIAIGKDGIVTAFVDGSRNGTALGRLKVVNPPPEELQKRPDGLFQVIGGQAAAVDANVRIVPGALESSNVNAVSTLVGMIALARQYELSMKLLANAQEGDRDAAKLLQANP